LARRWKGDRKTTERGWKRENGDAKGDGKRMERKQKE
jgi:hypothetical protein